MRQIGKHRSHTAGPAGRYGAPFDETIVELLVDNAIDGMLGATVGIIRSAVVFSKLA